MAATRFFDLPELVDMVMDKLDPSSIMAARHAHQAFFRAIQLSSHLKRKLLLLPQNCAPEIWKCDISSGFKKIVRVLTIPQDDACIAQCFTIKTPNPLILQRTHMNGDRDCLSDHLIAVDERQHERPPEAEQGADPDYAAWYGNIDNSKILNNRIDRLDINSKLFPIKLDKNTIYYNMFLFQEHVPVVTVNFDLYGLQGSEEGFWRTSKLVRNAQGVRLCDVLHMLKRECPPDNTILGWAMQISIDGQDVIFPTEEEKATVEKSPYEQEYLRGYLDSDYQF